MSDVDKQAALMRLRQALAIERVDPGHVDELRVDARAAGATVAEINRAEAEGALPPASSDAD